MQKAFSTSRSNWAKSCRKINWISSKFGHSNESLYNWTYHKTGNFFFKKIAPIRNDRETTVFSITRGMWSRKRPIDIMNVWTLKKIPQMRKNCIRFLAERHCSNSHPGTKIIRDENSPRRFHSTVFETKVDRISNFSLRSYAVSFRNSRWLM